MSKVRIIAELGINHNGKLETVEELIYTAKECGADLVKFQKRSLDRVYSKEELDKYRESPWGTTNRQQKEGLEFSKVDYDEIAKYCKRFDIGWFASPWDLESVEFLKQYNLPYNKIASAMLGHKDLLKAIAIQKKYTFISTGMHTLDEIQLAYNIFIDAGCPFELVYCNSQYPQPDNELNLRCIQTLKSRFECEVGYSSHSTGIMAPVLAAALGAISVEAHLTLDRAMYGSDQAASLEPHGFSKMVEYIRYTEQAFGDGEKVVYPGELPIKKKLARTKDF